MISPSLSEGWGGGRGVGPLCKIEKRLLEVVLTGLATQLIGRINGQQLPEAQQAQPVAARRFIQVMRRDNDGHALRVEAGEIIPKGMAQFGIDADSGFI